MYFKFNFSSYIIIAVNSIQYVVCKVCTVNDKNYCLQTILLSDSSSDDEEEERPVTHEDLQSMLKIHKYQKKHQMRFYQNPEVCW